MPTSLLGWSSVTYQVDEQDHLRQQKYEGTGYGQGSLFRVPFQAGLLRSLETWLGPDIDVTTLRSEVPGMTLGEVVKGRSEGFSSLCSRFQEVPRARCCQRMLPMPGPSGCADRLSGHWQDPAILKICKGYELEPLKRWTSDSNRDTLDKLGICPLLKHPSAWLWQLFNTLHLPLVVVANPSHPVEREHRSKTSKNVLASPHAPCNHPVLSCSQQLILA